MILKPRSVRLAQMDILSVQIRQLAFQPTAQMEWSLTHLITTVILAQTKLNMIRRANPVFPRFVQEKKSGILKHYSVKIVPLLPSIMPNSKDVKKSSAPITNSSILLPENANLVQKELILYNQTILVLVVQKDKYLVKLWTSVSNARKKWNISVSMKINACRFLPVSTPICLTLN